MIRLQNVFKMSFLQDVFARHRQDALKTSWKDVLNMSWRRLKDVLKKSWRCFCKTSWRRLAKVLKTYGQGEYIGLDQDVLWRRMINKNIFIFIKMSWRRRPKTSSSRRMFAGLVLIKLCYLIALRRHYSTAKCLFLHSFWSTEDNSSNKFDHRILTLFLLKMLIIFLLQDNAIHLSLESLKELFGFDNITCVLKCRQNIYWFFNM